MTNLASPNPVFALDPLAAALWGKLCRFSFDHGTGPRTFAARLAGEQGWSASFTALAIGEYRRFLLLFALDKLRGTDEGGQTSVRVVPSAVVDEVWHLHLLYTQSYWETLCRDILNGPLHHLPADGSADEAPALDAVYAETLDAYRRTFGQAAPESVWPAPTLRAAPGHSSPRDRRRSRGMAAGPMIVVAGLSFFAVFLMFQGMIPLGVLFLGMIGVVVAANSHAGSPARRRATRGGIWSGGESGDGDASVFGGSSDDGGHHGGSHDAGGHSHSCGGGHSCGGHGCGGHGCGGGCGGH